MAHQQRRPKRTGLPRRIYVRRERDAHSGDEMLTADVVPDSFDDGDVVGIYTLVDAKTLRVTRALE